MRLLFPLVLLACGPNAVEQAVRSAQPYEVDEVELEGVTRFEEAELLAYLHLGETTLFGDTHRYGEALVRTDHDRLVALYKAHGFYDVKVPEIRIEPIDEGTAMVVVVVEEGPQTVVRRVEVVGSDAPVSLEIGAPFEEASLGTVAKGLGDSLRDKGHGLAKVAATAEVDRRAGQADLVFTVDPGPVLSFGELELTGLVDVPEDLVRRELDFVEGRPWSPKLVARAEQTA